MAMDDMCCCQSVHIRIALQGLAEVLTVAQ